MMIVSTFESWDESIHNLPDQLKRIATAKKASTTPSSVNREYSYAIFPGSGVNPYETTLTECTCVDFSIRRLPCKHIYRLAMELGVFNADFSVGVNKNMSYTLQETVQMVENLDENAQKYVMNAIRYFIGIGSFESYVPNLTLLSCPMFVFSPLSMQASLEDYKKSDIVALLEKLDKLPEKKLLKNDLISYCCDNVPELADRVPTKYSVHAAERFVKPMRKTLEYLRRKYDSSYDYLDDGVKISFPYGARPASELLGGNIPGLNGLYCFPNDDVTTLLSSYGHNKCENGFVPVRVVLDPVLPDK